MKHIKPIIVTNLITGVQRCFKSQEDACNKLSLHKPSVQRVLSGEKRFYRHWKIEYVLKWDKPRPYGWGFCL